MDTVVADPRSAKEQDVKTTTNLYELMEAVQNAVGSENDDLVVAIVMDLLRSGRIRFLRHMGVHHCN